MSTILVDLDLCTRCGICADVCTRSIIDPADENNLPKVPDERAGACMRCGQCEAFCPSQALTLNFLPEEKEYVPAGAAIVSPEDLGTYIKMRRSVRHYKNEPVSKEEILKVLDIARYAASGGNRQSVGWLVVYDTKKVRRIAALTIDWMRTLVNSNHPMSGYFPMLIAAWDGGNDVICRNAPHLMIPHVPEDNALEQVNAIIALTHFDVAAPSFGIGTCWAGFVAGACREFRPLQEELSLPDGRFPAYAMMFGYPKYRVSGIPRRNPLQVAWR